MLAYFPAVPVKLRYSNNNMFALDSEIKLVCLLTPLYQKGQCKEADRWEHGFLHSATVVHIPKKIFSARTIPWSYFDHLGMRCYAGSTWWEGTNAEVMKKREQIGNICLTGSEEHCGTQVSWDKTCSIFFRNSPIYWTFLIICKSLLPTFASERQETYQHL